jgi:hypothetical protein
MCKATATIETDNKIDGNTLYQTIHIVPSKRTDLKYFIHDRYKAARAVDDILSKLYFGDGQTIVFREKQRFRNLITIKYEMMEGAKPDMTPKKFHISAEVPCFDGCDYCVQLRQSKKGMDNCLYYKCFLPRHKRSCIDFCERD